MHLLAGLDRPTNGRVKIGGEDITEMPDKRGRADHGEFRRVVRPETAVSALTLVAQIC